MKQITVVSENRTGLIAEISDLLGKAKINIEYLDGETFGDMATIFLEVDNYDKALAILRDYGFEAISEDGFVVCLENKPGALAKISKQLSEAKINLRSIRIVRKNQGNGLVLISTEHKEKAMELLKNVLVWK